MSTHGGVEHLSEDAIMRRVNALVAFAQDSHAFSDAHFEVLVNLAAVFAAVLRQRPAIRQRIERDALAIGRDAVLRASLPVGAA